MHYSQMLNAEYVDEYKKVHRSLFIGFNNILFEIAFLKKSFERQARSRKSAEYKSVLKSTYNNQYCMLIIDMFKTIFDNSGNNTMTLLKFKGSIKKYVMPQYKSNLIKRINDVWVYSEHEKTAELVSTFRNKLIAHNINYLPEIEVKIVDLEKAFNAACRLFAVLSFEPEDFYNETEIYGYDFTNGEALFEAEREALLRFMDIFLK